MLAFLIIYIGIPARVYFHIIQCAIKMLKEVGFCCYVEFKNVSKFSTSTWALGGPFPGAQFPGSRTLFPGS